MLPITLIFMILLNQLNESFTTRLPLEVFEIPSTSGQVYNSNSRTNTINSINNNNSGSWSLSTTYTNHINNNNNNNNIKQKSAYNRHTDRRHSRQMLDILQLSEEEQHQYDHQTIHPTRILYQIGESEQDLPICSPNAVCSKIDLYQTPWIERQCRCPEMQSYKKLQYTISHHKEHHINNGHDKLHAYFVAEKNAQQKRLLDIEDNNLDSGHFKKLMQKLGAVYEDQLIFEKNDLHDIDEISNNAYEEHKIKFSNPYRNNLKSSNLINNKNHMRHMGHKSSKDIPYIGGCPSSLGIEDGHTIADKTRHYKLCNPVHKMPVCRYFRDYTWTLSTSPEMNVTEQVVHCRCPRNSVTYLTKREPLVGGQRNGFTYLFACSPQTRLRCQRKEPCKLFTVRKRQEFLDEVNTNSLCQCPRGHTCPRHHTDSGVIAGESYIQDNIQTYSGFCMAND